MTTLKYELKPCEYESLMTFIKGKSLEKQFDINEKVHAIATYENRLACICSEKYEWRWEAEWYKVLPEYDRLHLLENGEMYECLEWLEYLIDNRLKTKR